MVKSIDWKAYKGLRIRIKSALRCLCKKHYVLVCWDGCEDGEIDFKITHKGVELPEAAHRLRVDAAEILQDIHDQNLAVNEVKDILY